MSAVTVGAGGKPSKAHSCGSVKADSGSGATREETSRREADSGNGAAHRYREFLHGAEPQERHRERNPGGPIGSVRAAQVCSAGSSSGTGRFGDSRGDERRDR